MPRKKKIFLIISLFYILYTVVPIVPDVTGIEGWIVNLLTFIVLFLLYPKAYLNPLFFWFLAYATILFFYVLFGKPLTIGIGTVHDSKKMIIEYAWLLPSLSIFSILYYLKDFKLFQFISIGGLILLVFSFLYLLPLSLSGHNMLREAVSSEMYESIKVIGTPSYTLLHAYVLALPAILYGLKVSFRPEKWYMIAVTVLLLFIILNSYITTSLIISLGVIIFYMFFDIKQKAKSIGLMMFIILITIVLHTSGVFLNLFDVLIDFFEGTATQPKIEGFKYIYMYGNIESAGGHITGRMNFHDLSWKSFTDNILIGGDSQVGGHSQILDRLGGMGLLTFTPFIMMIISQIRMVLRLIKNNEQRVYYFLGIAAAFTLLYQKGLFGQEGWLFMMVLMPGLIIALGSKKTVEINR